MTTDTTATTPMDPDDLALLMAKPDAPEMDPALLARHLMVSLGDNRRLTGDLASEQERARVLETLWRAERRRAQRAERSLDLLLNSLPDAPSVYRAHLPALLPGCRVRG